MKKLLILISLILWFWFSLSYEVKLPNSTNDIQSTASITTSDTKNYYQSLAKEINTYLWFIFGSIALAMVIYWWILLIGSNWDPADLKKANKILVWWLVWIFVSLLAYLIIKLLINLF